MKSSLALIVLGLIVIPGAILLSQDDLFDDLNSPPPSDVDGLFGSDASDSDLSAMDVASDSSPLGSGDAVDGDDGHDLDAVFGDDTIVEKPKVPSLGSVDGFADTLGDEPARPALEEGGPGYAEGYGAVEAPQNSGHAALAPIFRKILQLKNSLKTTKDSRGKSAIARQLRKEVDRYFDEDLKRRRIEIRKLKRKIAEMEEGLDRRERAKKKIVELQIQTFFFEAQGFGLFNSIGPASNRGLEGAPLSEVYLPEVN